VLVLVAGPVPLAALGPETLDRLPVLVRPATVLAAGLGVLGLAGAVGFGGLAAAGLEWSSMERAAAVGTAAEPAGNGRLEPELVPWTDLGPAEAPTMGTGTFAGGPDEGPPHARDERAREEDLEERL
jgi:hypothetical protein